jgi:putative tryptophan/tyrosine transport system substrate-binding protein
VAARGARAAKRTDAACSYIDERRRGRPGDPSASRGHSTGASRFGWSEGRNVEIDYRYASASAEQARLLARDLVALKPEVIVAAADMVATALQRETSAIPIVFVGAIDPVGTGLVASLARPGGNLTGTLLNEEGIVGKWLAMLKEMAPELIAAGPIATRAAQAATKTIPILAASDDMVEDGLVTSMRRPGGNTTGVSLLAPELDGKRQDLIMEAVPGIRRIAVLSDPHVSTPQHLQDLKEAARVRGVELLVFSATTPGGIVPAMNEASVASVQALNVLATPLFFFNRQTVLARATELRLPAIYQWPEMAEQGGLAGYGPRITQWFRQLARLLVQVLRGANPGELPVEQPTRFELVLNLQAAKAIGHEIPAGLVLRADKVIE